MSIDIPFKLSHKHLQYLYEKISPACHIDQYSPFTVIGDQSMKLTEFPEEEGYYMYWTKDFVSCKLLNEWCLKSNFKSIVLFCNIGDYPYVVLTNWENKKIDNIITI